MNKPDHHEPLAPTLGLTLHAPVLYDFTVGVMTFGRERKFRENLLRLAELKTGETVLDVGCGTGSLALAAKRQVGPAGKVYGIDASTEMLARASRKARRAGLEVDFRQAPAQELPLTNASIDLVTSTLMLHHLGSSGRARLMEEVRRVLKPAGRLLLVDFTTTAGRHAISHFHRHGAVSFDAMIELCWDTGLKVVDSGDVGFRGLRFVLASAPRID